MCNPSIMNVGVICVTGQQKREVKVAAPRWQPMAHLVVNHTQWPDGAKDDKAELWHSVNIDRRTEAVANRRDGCYATSAVPRHLTPAIVVVVLWSGRGGIVNQALMASVSGFYWSVEGQSRHSPLELMCIPVCLDATLWLLGQKFKATLCHCSRKKSKVIWKLLSSCNMQYNLCC